MTPFLAQIMLFGGNFAPRGWAFCNGQSLKIADHSALFSLLGTTYGGDGRSTFALPDLRGRVPIHAGTGPGLTPRRLGQAMGQETVTLDEAQLPAHAHSVNVGDVPACDDSPAGDVLASAEIYSDQVGQMVPLAEASGGAAGGGQPHENMQPSLCVNYIIALDGTFPSRA